MPPAREGRARVAERRAAVVLTCAAAIGSSALDDEPVRVVSLVPPASALLVELGAAATIVGRADDDRTPEIRRVAVVGTVLRPSAEAIRAVDPDLVLLASNVHAAGLEAVLSSTTDLREVRLERLADVAREARALGASVGRIAEADRLAVRIESALEAIGPWPRSCAPPEVVWAVGLEPPVIAGASTLPDDLLRAVGARNAFAAVTGWARPGLEALVGADADVLLWPVGPELGRPDQAGRSPAWRRLRSVREGRVIALDADLVHEAGPRIASAARAVAEALRAHCPGQGGSSGLRGARPPTDRLTPTIRSLLR